MVNFDYLFTYKYLLKHLITLKLNIKYSKHSKNIPILSKLLYFFSLNNFTDKNKISILNYFYLFKFFFGRNAYLTKYKNFFNLGYWSYSVKIFISINKELYTILFYYLSDYIVLSDKIFIKYGIFSKQLNIFYIIMKDLNVFTEKKINLGLFNLENSLNLHLYFSGGDIFSSKIILLNLKLKYFN